MNCDTIKPPTMTNPSGRRDAPSAPKPRAIGTAPISAASVVMMIGRKRFMLASWIASTLFWPWAMRCRAKSISMMPFFLTIPISMNRPMKA